MTSELITQLRQHGEAAKGTDLGGVLQWALLHIESQDEALAELREELENEERARLSLEVAQHHARQAIETALQAVNQQFCPPIELARDTAPHINLMGGHYKDPDYLRGQLAAPHVDLRESKPRARKAA